MFPEPVLHYFLDSEPPKKYNRNCKSTAFDKAAPLCRRAGSFQMKKGGIGLIKKLGAMFLAAVFALLVAVPAFAQEGDRLSAATLNLKVGETVKITAYAGSEPVSQLFWSSSNPSTVMVDGWGNVTGQANGSATVTAKFPDGQVRTCTVTVGMANIVARGIDVSEHNSLGKKPIVWSAVKSAGFDFAMIRTGYGSEDWANQTDEYFEDYYNGAKQNGLKVGAYHYSYATNTAMAAQEAEFCLHILNGRPMDYPVVYDVEDKSQLGLSTEALGQIVQTFCSRIQQAGYRTAVYSFTNFYNAHLTSPLVRQYDLWIAHTGGVSAPGVSVPYTMWQYAQENVPGIDGICDVDYSFCDYAGGSPVPSDPTPSNPAPSDPTPGSPNPATRFLCDTQSYDFGNGRNSYIYKITTDDASVPTAVSSNPSAVSVTYSGRTSGGYLFTIANKGAGEATVTTTSADGNYIVSFRAVGRAAAASVLRCDTSAYTFQPGGASYYYKITPLLSENPSAVSSNPAAVSVSFSKKLTDGYLFRIDNKGSGSAVITTKAPDGSAVSFTAAGSSRPQAPGLQSDTPLYFTMKKGASYQFKLTGKAGAAYRFGCGNSSVIRAVSTVKSGGSYYYKIRAVGAGTAGVYATPQGGSGVRFCIVTVRP